MRIYSWRQSSSQLSPISNAVASCNKSSLKWECNYVRSVKNHIYPIYIYIYILMLCLKVSAVAKRRNISESSWVVVVSREVRCARCGLIYLIGMIALRGCLNLCSVAGSDMDVIKWIWSNLFYIIFFVCNLFHWYLLVSIFISL